MRKAHARGYGFVTPGTLGGPLRGQAALPRRRIPFFAPLAVIVVAIFAMKAGLQLGLGPARYDAQLAMLAQGDSLHRAAAQVMAVDPLSRALAQAALRVAAGKW
ncbi:hypothetical protein FGG78_21565 [Thioclava sp. BHET1]|nr:hypothetical protein FGG78_21565 [Thioclava sp. BHET1]